MALFQICTKYDCALWGTPSLTTLHGSPNHLTITSKTYTFTL